MRKQKKFRPRIWSVPGDFVKHLTPYFNECNTQEIEELFYWRGV